MAFVWLDIFVVIYGLLVFLGEIKTSTIECDFNIFLHIE